MATHRAWAFEGVPDDVMERLRGLGLRVDDKGDQAVLHGTTLVIDAEAGRVPVDLITRTLGCRSVCTAEASFKRLEQGGEVSWEVVRVGGGRESVVITETDGVDEEDCQGDEDALVATYVGLGLKSVLPAKVTPQSFGLKVPRNWRPPDPFARAARGEPRVIWSVGEDTCPIDAITLQWLRARLDAAGRLDAEQTAPDLARWERRLLARHGSVDAPGYAADWAALTQPERARTSTRAGYVPAWKMGVHPAELVAAEVQTLAELLALPATRPPDPLIEAVAEVRAILDCGAPLTVTPVKAG